MLGYALCDLCSVCVSLHQLCKLLKYKKVHTNYAPRDLFDLPVHLAFQITLMLPTPRNFSTLTIPKYFTYFTMFSPWWRQISKQEVGPLKYLHRFAAIWILTQNNLR